MIYIIAGNSQQAKVWEQEQPRLAPGHTRYVATGDMLRGLLRPVVVLVGTYYTRADWPDLERYLPFLEAAVIGR